MNLTKRQALEICRDMWDWLADNPGKEKGDWPGWKEVGGMLADCSCCEYGKQRDAACEICPLLDYWGKGDSKGTTPCRNTKSIYLKWWKARQPRRRTMYAKRIANYARKALKELGEGGAS